MNVAVGLIEGARVVSVSLKGEFRDAAGRSFPEGGYRFSKGVVLDPVDARSSVFVLDDFTIGIGFHWERIQARAFRGRLRIVQTPGGLTAVIDLGLEDYVESVIASEMSPDSPLDLLKAHAVISRSWLVAQMARREQSGTFRRIDQVEPGKWELLCWYGRKGHDAFDVCADDHCQRYQGLPPAGSGRARDAVRATSGEFLLFDGEVCDARFYKCCGGVTEAYRTAWEDRDVPYLSSVFDGTGTIPRVDEQWLVSTDIDASCNTRDPELLGRILPGFDQETADFFRWTVEYSADELSELVHRRSGLDLGAIRSLEPLSRGPSGRISRLRIDGTRGSLSVGKELEIRRLLSMSHLYSSAFVVTPTAKGFLLRGGGWGHGVGLCQIGAAVMAETGASYAEILGRYYPGAALGLRPPGFA